MLVLLFSLLLVDQASQAEAPPEFNDGWDTRSLAEAGFDQAKMQALSEKLLSNGHRDAHMVLVEHDGKLIYEQYLSGEDQNWGSHIGFVEFDRDTLHDLRSISKSVTALLVGIALQRFAGGDFEKALDTPITDYLPGYDDQVATDHERITLQHVLTMTEGLDWNEMDVPYSDRKNDEIQLYYTRDPIRYVLEKSLRSEPGSAWYYNGGTTMLLAGAIQTLTGRTFLEFAEEALFKPLGIQDYYWNSIYTWPRGLPSAASGLRLRGRDLAKIGHLMMHQGKWNGTQVVPSEWVRLSSLRHTEQTQSDWSMDGIYGYGYQWWHGEFPERWNNATVITGTGYGGQKLFIIPSMNMVVTVMAGTYGKGGWTMPEDILAEIIAAAPQ